MAEDNKKKPNPWSGRHEWGYKDQSIFCDGKIVAFLDDPSGKIADDKLNALGEWIIERLQVEAILNAMLSGGVIP